MNNNDSRKINPLVIAFVGLSVLVILLLIGNSLPDNKRKPTVKAAEKIKTTQKTHSNKNVGHFIVEAENNVQEINKKSEEYYLAMPSLTGLPSGESLDLDTIKITVFKTTANYAKETGKPSWSEGFADVKNKEIFIVQSDGLLISILPHEISHLFFDSYMEFENAEVNWLDEGLATLVQVEYDKEQAPSFANAMHTLRSGNVIPFEQLRTYKLTESTPVEQINVYYAQTLSLTYYLKNSDLKKWQSLLKKLRAGIRFDVALRASYNLNSQKLLQDWQVYIKNNKQSWEN